MDDELLRDRDDDLSVLGQPDTDNLDIPDEGVEGFQGGKVKAAFVKLRQQRRQERETFREELQKKDQELTRISGQLNEANVERQRARAPEGVSRRRAYHENVRQRALGNLAGETFTSEQERDAAVWQEMTAITSNDAAQLAVQKLATLQSPQVLGNVLGEFTRLDDDDRTAIRDIVDKLPLDLKLNPDAIRKEVHSYVGQNIEKFSQPQQNGDKGGRVRGSTPATGQKTSDGKISLSRSAGAAAASGLKGGSLGVRLSEGPAPKTRPAPKLTDDDIAIMKQQGADFTDPEEVKLFLEGKETAHRKSLGA